MFIRSTALCVFHIAELFIKIKTKCLLYYSSNPLNEQAVKYLGQLYVPVTVQTVQQFSFFSRPTSSTRKWCPFGRQNIEVTKSRIFFPHFLSRIFSIPASFGENKTWNVLAVLTNHNRYPLFAASFRCAESFRNLPHPQWRNGTC